jgi:hypothetical protein
MRKLLTLVCFSFIVAGLSAQVQPQVRRGKPANGQTWRPENTEIWYPVPAKVTPGEGTAAPSDAIVLFDGTNLNEWESSNAEDPTVKWKLEGGNLIAVGGVGSIQTKRWFGDCQLHIEFRSPAEVKGDGQGRGNSGIFLQNLYEVQVLDGWENSTYSNGMLGSIYKQYAPLVNPAKKPGEWQTYDIIYTAPVFGLNGVLVTPGYLTVLLNGVLVQNHSELKGSTEYIGMPKYNAHGLAPISLQDHSNPVAYRNIWIRQL